MCEELVVSHSRCKGPISDVFSGMDCIDLPYENRTAEITRESLREKCLKWSLLNRSIFEIRKLRGVVGENALRLRWEDKRSWTDIMESSQFSSK